MHFQLLVFWATLIQLHKLHKWTSFTQLTDRLDNNISPPSSLGWFDPDVGHGPLGLSKIAKRLTRVTAEGSID